MALSGRANGSSIQFARGEEQSNHGETLNCNPP